MTTPNPDARPPESDVETIARLTRDLEDLRSTVLARVSRGRTGTIETTVLAVAEPGALLVQGQTLPRTTYPALWQWIVDRTPAGFATTATTLTLPDWRGRTPVGATDARPPGTLFGSATKTLAVANLPAHSHTGGTGVDNPSHTHGGRTGADTPGHTHYTGGNHGGHRPNQAPGVGGQGASWPTTAETYSGDAGWSGGANVAHGHDFGTGNASNAHAHGFTTDQTGSGTPVNVEAPSVSVNWLIWT